MLYHYTIQMSYLIGCLHVNSPYSQSVELAGFSFYVLTSIYTCRILATKKLHSGKDIVSISALVGLEIHTRRPRRKANEIILFLIDMQLTIDQFRTILYQTVTICKQSVCKITTAERRSNFSSVILISFLLTEPH